MARPNQARLDLAALRHNLALAREIAPRSRVMAVVKANGYGHGAVTIASALEPLVDALAVACTEEALELREAGIGSIEALLKAGATPEGRRDLAEKTDIGNEYILDWVNRADLMRVRGVGEEYSDLLEWAGVDTVVELAQRNPENLYKKMLEINEEKKLVRRPPTASMVARWVAHAKELPRAVSY